ncbi:glycosyltransferase family 2 protein [Streptomyces bambusae]|uniref:glycosyltransferase family 2 protein n=1 Tax=Streptomyces bambusae TaxID=1550616 RepID=UPI001CFC5E3F|nr:galactosyltransferase-related protein [Streptomyces bambusae]MCB5166501.1 glycosyltransferase family 2 protein [Streptomyces bambusae]
MGRRVAAGASAAGARRVAVITPVSGRHAHLAFQQAGLARGTRRPDHYVVVTMADAAAGQLAARGDPPADPVSVPVPRPGRLPLAAARNAGARRALAAGADVLVFLDVDCVPGTAAVERYVQASHDGALWCGTVTYLPPPPPAGYRLADLPATAAPHPARPDPAPGESVPGTDPDLFWSLSFAVTAATWRRIGGFCELYSGYGGEDTDFARLARRAGVGIRWLGGAPAYHQHHPVEDPPVRHLHDILRNGALFHSRWGSWPMGGWLQAFERLGLAGLDPVTGQWVAM